jgi:hypothetical protein
MSSSNKDHDLERAEDNISSMLSTMMSVSAVLATISLGVLAIIEKWSSSPTKIIITGCILISAFFFLLSFRQGIVTWGTLILAIKEKRSGFEEARKPANILLYLLLTGVSFLGIACFFFFISTFLPILNVSGITFNLKITSNFYKIISILGYLSIIIGSVGMIFFATRFPFSTRIKDLQSVKERLFGIFNGYQVWKWSWILILIGSVTQAIMILIN